LFKAKKVLRFSTLEEFGKRQGLEVFSSGQHTPPPHFDYIHFVKVNFLLTSFF